MKFFNRHKRCFGFMIYRWNRFTVELWFVPPRFTVDEHSHPNEDIELYHVHGKCDFVRRRGVLHSCDSVSMPSFSMLRHFTVPSGWNHWFSTTDSWLVFFNVAKWKVEPTSASVDFKLKHTKE